ncbi:hypothetical protein EMN47_16565 [Prolixibacteraceae bacterium JC049]|nr:hypothetical protein [Prolixibacteraceae bacterium JC049]
MRRNALILVGTLIILLFSVFVYVTSDQMNKKTQTIAHAMAHYAASNNIQFLQNKFDQLFLQAQYLSEGVQALTPSSARKEAFQQLLNHTADNELQIASQWIWLSSPDTSFISNRTELKQINRQSIIDDSKRYSPKWMSYPYWDKLTQKQLVTFTLPISNGNQTIGIVGIDIDLMQIHQLLAAKGESGYGYTAMISANRKIAMHPDEKRIGSTIDSFPEFSNYSAAIHADTTRYTNIIHSDFLDLPVLQIYTPLNLGYAQNWMISVNIPVFNYMDIPNKIRRNLIYTGIISIVIMLLILYFALGRWQYEIQRRQTLEKEKKELALQSERQSRENMEAQLNNLKNQLNPHFLFNSLSSLYTLVGKDKELARQFVMKLSKLYRNLLLKHKENTVTLKNEMDFTQHYLFLQKIRFGEALQYEIDVPEEHLSQYILSQSLISLAENAIKHNIATKEQPLHIKITFDENALVICNNYNPSGNSTNKLGTGLKNIHRRYELLGMNFIQPEITENNYMARLPIIKHTF